LVLQHQTYCHCVT